MPRYPAKERPLYTDPSQLPLVLKTKDVVDLVGCCKSNALEVIRSLEEDGLTVIWIGNSRKEPRISRDALLAFLNRGVEDPEHAEQEAMSS